MSRFRVGLAAVAMIAVGVFVFTGGGGAANAAPIPGGSIQAVCTAGTLNGTTYTLSADCGDVTGPITVPSTITTVNGNGFTISATDIGSRSVQRRNSDQCVSGSDNEHRKPDRLRPGDWVPGLHEQQQCLVRDLLQRRQRFGQ